MRAPGGRARSPHRARRGDRTRGRRGAPGLGSTRSIPTSTRSRRSWRTRLSPRQPGSTARSPTDILLAAGRGPVHDQGEPRRGRAPDHRRGRGLPGSGGCGRRPGGRAAPGGGCDPPGSHEHAGPGHAVAHRQRAVRCDPQPVGPRLVSRRIQRRRGGCAGHRDVTPGHRQRLRGLHQAALGSGRHGGPSSDGGPCGLGQLHQPLPAAADAAALRRRRPHGSSGGGREARLRAHVWTRRPRPEVGAGTGPAGGAGSDPGGGHD